MLVVCLIYKLCLINFNDLCLLFLIKTCSAAALSEFLLLHVHLFFTLSFIAFGSLKCQSQRETELPSCVEISRLERYVKTHKEQ